MPPLPPVPSVIRLAFEGYVDNTDTYSWANVLHFAYTGTAPTNATCVTIATDASSHWATRMAPQCPSPTQLTRVTVTDLTSNTAGNGEWVGTIAGTRGDDSIPANAAMLISYPINTRYRGGHPRQYLYVGGNADLLGAAGWSAALVAAVQLAWQELLADLQSISESGTTLSQFCAVSYVSKEENPVPPYRRAVPLVYDINASLATARTEIASQRGRVGRRRS